MAARRFTVRTQVRVQRTVRVQRSVRWQGHQQVTQQQHRAINATSRSLPPRQASVLADDGYGPLEDPYREFDLFMSHATENKDFVRPLAEALTARGVRVWFDEIEIGVGDSLRESIDRGLSRCRFGAVVLSSEFFAKRWTAYELNGLVAREIQGRKVILPIWHPQLAMADLLAFSPTLADKKALVGAHLNVEQIADELAALIAH